MEQLTLNPNHKFLSCICTLCRQGNNPEVMHSCEILKKEPKVSIACTDIHIYHSLVNERPWMELIPGLPKRGMGALLSVSTFNYERAPMSCFAATQYP